MMDERQLLVFSLDEHRYGLPLFCAERVFRAPAVTPLPKAPEIVIGVINLRGSVVPVVDIRQRFRRAVRAVRLSDQLVVAHAATRVVAFFVDRVDGVAAYGEQDLIAPDAIAPGLEYVRGIVVLNDGLVVIQDLDAFLSLEEETVLADALETGGSHVE